MECPHCHEEIPGKKCSRCEALVPGESRYCMYCGTDLEGEALRKADEEEQVNLDDRIPCPDGTCTGIIVDGKCTECGKPSEQAASAGSV